MKWLLVGHRGVGKTKLLARLKVYIKNQKLSFLDLDSEIEIKYKKKLTDLFVEWGEKKFREVENGIFRQIIKDNPELILSVGAGFNPSALELSSIP